MSPYELGASLLSKCTARATFGVLGISVGEGALVPPAEDCSAAGTRSLTQSD